MTLLLKKKANVDAKDAYGNTSLHFACYYEQNEVIPVLLDPKNKADGHARNIKDQTPLHYASGEGATDIVTLLLNNYLCILLLLMERMK